MMPGDRVLAVGERPQISEPERLPQEVRLAAGSEMPWVIERNGQRMVANVTPRADPPAGQGGGGHRL